jgi:hypothetical protein
VRRAKVRSSRRKHLRNQKNDRRRRISDCGSGGRWFESTQLYQIAQQFQWFYCKGAHSRFWMQIRRTQCGPRRLKFDRRGGNRQAPIFFIAQPAKPRGTFRFARGRRDPYERAARRQVLTGAPFLQTQDCEGPPAAVQKFRDRTSEPRAIFKFGIRNDLSSKVAGGSTDLITLARRARPSPPSDRACQTLQ